jgi:hypothetical protein
MENWLRRDCFEKRRRKWKSLRFVPGNGCPFLVSQYFLFFKKSFSKCCQERGEAGWCRNMKAQREKSKLEFKVFFKVLKFLSLFRCEEHLYTRLRWLVRPSVRQSVPHDAITRKTGYVAIASRGGEGRGN